jgi:hypothetical protein
MCLTYASQIQNFIVCNSLQHALPLWWGITLVCDPVLTFPVLSRFHNCSTPVSHGQLPWDIHEFCRASLLFQGMIVDWFSSTDRLTLLHRAGRHSACNLQPKQQTICFWYPTLVTGSMQSYDRALGMMDMWPADIVKRKRSKLDFDEQNDE